MRMRAGAARSLRRGQAQTAADPAPPPPFSLPQPLPLPLDPRDARRQATDLGEPYRVPAAVLAGTRAAPAPPPAPEAPLLVLVNAAAGGRAGAALAAALRRALGADQVFDLAEHDPAVVLKRVYENLTALASAGDYASIAVRSRLVLLAAGGDGTVAWVLKAVSDLKLTPRPPSPSSRSAPATTSPSPLAGATGSCAGGCAGRRGCTRR